MTTAVECRSLVKRYGKHEALHGIDLSVRTGTVFGLVGPNGAGKTTTLRILLDVIRPTAGSVRVLGEEPRTGGPRLRRRIGYVPGELRLEGRVRARSLLQHLAELSGPVAPGTVESLAERLDLDLDRPVRSLSKGSRQKIGLVQAFMHRPELLVLDEPTSGLDPLVQREFLRMVREASEAGQTVLLSSHVLSEIQQAADDVAVLAAGRVVAEGTVSSLRMTGTRRVHATLAGTSAEAVRGAFSSIEGVEELDVAEAGSIVRVAAHVRGDMGPVVHALAVGSVRDLTVEEPDLEESVLDLYSRTEASR